MRDTHKDRWKLLECDIKQGELVVQDALFKKKRSFHVPMLVCAIVEGHDAYVSTSSRKVMHIELNSAKRQFISASTLTPEQHQYLFPKEPPLKNT